MQAGARGAMGVEGIPGEPDQPSPWVHFPHDMGWTDNTLRHRLIFADSTVQFDGRISGQVGANAQAQIGALSAAFRPSAARVFAVGVNSGLTGGTAHLEIQANGTVLVRPSVAMSFVGIQVVYPLD